MFGKLQSVSRQRLLFLGSSISPPDVGVRKTREEHLQYKCDQMARGNEALGRDSWLVQREEVAGFWPQVLT